MEPVNYILRHGDTLYQLARRYQTTVQCLLARNLGIDPQNLRVGSSIVINPGEKCTGAAQPGDIARSTLHDEMRQAWEQHVYWARMATISIAERLRDQDATVARLLQNPGDIAGVFEPYFGASAANELKQLLTTHVQLAGDLVTALRDGQADRAKALQKQWYANADQLAEAFAHLSAQYPLEETRRMLYEHLGLETQMTAMRLAGRYAEDIEAFNNLERQAIAMADYFSRGITG